MNIINVFTKKFRKKEKIESDYINRLLFDCNQKYFRSSLQATSQVKAKLSFKQLRLAQNELFYS